MSASIFQINHGRFNAVIDAVGAQLRAFGDSGRNLLWPGSPAWQRSAPILFPVTGRLHGDMLWKAGQAHSHPMHGIVRDLPFTPVARDTDHLQLRLDHAADDVFPWDFRLEALYTIDDDGLELALTVINPSASMRLPFQLGWHPGLSWGSGEWSLSWAEKLPVTELEVIPGDGRRSGNERFLGNINRLAWHDRPTALVCRAPGLSGVRLSRDGFAVNISYHPAPPTWLFWSVPGAPFLCVEGWHGLPDRADRTSPFERREIMRNLPARGHWKFHCRLSPAQTV